MIKKSFCLLIFLLFIYPVSASPQSNKARKPDWINFRSDEGEFSILMPGQPQKHVQSKEVAFGTIYNYVFYVTAEGVDYIASYTDMPVGPTDKGLVDRAMNGARDNMLQGSKGRLLAEKDISIDSYPGREIKVENTYGLTLNRAYFVKQRLYHLIVEIHGSKTGSEAALKAAERFLDSFKLLSK
jgi:hypothetical protein